MTTTQEYNLKYISYDIVFQEIPGETTLAINISNCPNRCKGCHSPYLQEDKGETLTFDKLCCIINKYIPAISCVCFMGGDISPKKINELAEKTRTKYNIKTGWYSGKPELSKEININNFDFIKTGPYIERRGGLSSPFTNQRFYIISNGNMILSNKTFIKK